MDTAPRLAPPPSIADRVVNNEPISGEAELPLAEVYLNVFDAEASSASASE